MVIALTTDFEEHMLRPYFRIATSRFNPYADFNIGIVTVVLLFNVKRGWISPGGLNAVSKRMKLCHPRPSIFVSLKSAVFLD